MRIDLGKRVELTVSAEAAELVVLQPQDVLQPIRFEEVRKPSQSTDED